MLFNDEIMSISEVGLRETVDITVDKDHLFYCNGILTHNSFGLPATADFMFAIVRDEELDAKNQMMVKILKNRYGDIAMRNKETGEIMSRFLIGVDRSQMKLYDLDESAQSGLDNEAPPTGPPTTAALLNEAEIFTEGEPEKAPVFDIDDVIETELKSSNPPKNDIKFEIDE